MIFGRTETNGARANLFGPSTAMANAWSTRVVIPSRMQVDTEATIQRYKALRAYRVNNRLYDELRKMLSDLNLPPRTIAGFRNPANAVIEFYPATVWPGANLREALPIEVEINPGNREVQAEKERAERLTNAAYQILGWSNWAKKKQSYVRDLATLGDQFIKVASRRNISPDGTGDGVRRVFLQTIRPEDVIEFDVDERGFITYIRVDVPRQTRRQDGSLREYIHVEVWDKRAGTYRVWELPKDEANKETERLGEAQRTESIQRLIGDDFVPFVHTKFIDDGELRGMAAIEPALDKIDELNAMASRLHRRLFLYGTSMEQMVSNFVDPDGMPLGAPGSIGEITYQEEGDVLVPPPGYKLEGRNVNINFEAQLDAIKAHWDHLRQTDLPELGWGQVGDTTREMAGIALRILLTAPLAKAIEVRGNAEADLIRALQMGITVAQNANLPGFDEAAIGEWSESGRDFEMSFTERSIIPLTEEEEAEIEKAKAEAAEKKAGLGWSNDQLQREFGLTSEEIDRMKRELPAESAAGALLDAALRRGDGDA